MFTFKDWTEVGVEWPIFCNRCGWPQSEEQAQEYPEGSGLAFCVYCLPKEVAMQQAPIMVAANQTGDSQSPDVRAA